MKTRLTLLTLVKDTSKEFLSDGFLNVLISDENSDCIFPHAYVTVKSPEDMLIEMFEKYFYTDFNWFNVNLEAFRKVKDLEYEVVYCTVVQPVMNLNKQGILVDTNQELKIDQFYGDIIARRRTIF